MWTQQIWFCIILAKLNTIIKWLSIFLYLIKLELIHTQIIFKSEIKKPKYGQICMLITIYTFSSIISKAFSVKHNIHRFTEKHRKMNIKIVFLKSTNYFILETINLINFINSSNLISFKIENEKMRIRWKNEVNIITKSTFTIYYPHKGNYDNFYYMLAVP